GLRLLLLRLRWTFVFRLWLRLSPWRRCGAFRTWRRSRRRRHTLASWLLLSHRPRRSFSLRRTSPTLDLFLLTAWLLLWLLAFLPALFLLNATCFTLLLTTAFLLSLRRTLLLHRSLRSLS